MPFKLTVIISTRFTFSMNCCHVCQSTETGFRAIVIDSIPSLTSSSLRVWPSPDHPVCLCFCLQEFMIDKEKSIQWLGGIPPSDEPPCGFDGMKCFTPDNSRQVSSHLTRLAVLCRPGAPELVPYNRLMTEVSAVLITKCSASQLFSSQSQFLQVQGIQRVSRLSFAV